MYTTKWCIGFAMVCSVVSAHAGTIAYDGFDYAPGSLSGDNGGTGFLTPWTGNPNVVVQKPGLSHPFGQPSSGLDIGGGFVVSRGLIGSLAQSEYWASFEINSNPGNDQVWLGLDTVPTNVPGIAFGRRLDKFFLEVGPTTVAAGGVPSGTGITDLLVARFTQVGPLTKVDVWANTNDFTLPPLLSTSVPTVAYTWVNVEVQPGLFADEIRLGTSAAFVASSVPEPQTQALFGVGLVAAGFAFNRRQCRH